MPTANMSLTTQLAGISASGTISRSASGQLSYSDTLPAGKTGTLATWVSGSNVTITLEADHGFVFGDVGDVYWAAGMRYGMTVTVVAGNDVTFDGGTGDGIPNDPGLSMIATKYQTIDLDFDGDLMEMLVVFSSRRAHVQFFDAGDVLLRAVPLTASEPWPWVSGWGYANPLTGNPVAYIQATCGEATAGILKIGTLFDATE